MRNLRELTSLGTVARRRVYTEREGQKESFASLDRETVSVLDRAALFDGDTISPTIGYI